MMVGDFYIRTTFAYYKPGDKMCYFEKSELLTWMRKNRVSSIDEIEHEEHLRLMELAKKQSLKKNR